MPGEPDPKALKALEEEAQRCERNQDFLGALDAYEEIEEHGWATATHLAAMGYCYLKNRQRQNARETWFKALEKDAEAKQPREMLDRYFPKWEQELKRRMATRASAAAPKGDEEAPPPPPPPGFAGSAADTISIETKAREAPPAKPPLKARRPVDPEKTYSLRPAPGTGPATPKKPSLPAKQKQPIEAVIVKPPVEELGEEAPVNWEYVMNDVVEELGREK